MANEFSGTSDIDALAASMLMGIGRYVDFADACLARAAQFAEIGCPSCLIGAGFEQRAWRSHGPAQGRSRDRCEIRRLIALMLSA